MKLVITGHNSGIGKAVYEKFESEGWECVGFDIPDGDVTNDNVKREILNQCGNADVFVNNALPHQSLILASVHNRWLGADKLIINISSAVTYFYQKSTVPSEFYGYYDHKLALDATTKRLQQDSLPRLINLRPSWVDTKLAQGIDKPKMSTKDISDTIYTLSVTKFPVHILDLVVR